MQKVESSSLFIRLKPPEIGGLCFLNEQQTSYFLPKLGGTEFETRHFRLAADGRRPSTSGGDGCEAEIAEFVESSSFNDGWNL